ncbi:serine threonine kinase fnkB [Fusarium napiforme]|uniref:Serine threonine kinase fnkB n=1 Tax=Fusarium napiforme TaxID=42672 RepID=A0A8H5NDH2_9HYPO|nr:serine threonine kinase fnkB [Fusarium napiforme]
MNGPAESPPGYHVGDVLELHILQSNTDLLPQSVTISVRISQLITNPMPIVVRVNFDTGCAILKLYDRLFGAQFRECDDKNIPYCDKAKATYDSFLQRGATEPFLQELDDERSTPREIPRRGSDIRDEPDGVARFEAMLWRYAYKAFKTETEAYTRMQGLQGVLVPKPYATVRVVTARENTQEDECLDIHGILLEPIAGCSLSDLIAAPWAPTTKEEWFSIVQSAVDSTHEINKRGIGLCDSVPRNVVVDQTTHQVFIVDFAECFFRDTMFDRWAKKAEGWNAEA